MKALLFERSPARYAASRVAGTLLPGSGARVGPLTLADVDEPDLPGPGWHRVRPRLAGICGSDLSTLDGHASRYFEPVVSFPFVPRHEVVGSLEDGTRVVIEPVLGCVARAITPPCEACATGDVGGCQQVAFGHLKPGLQTGYCADVGGGWSTALESQLHPVPEGMSDEDAVMVEPAACAAHAVVRAGVADGAVVAVIGAGTLGLCTVAALRRLSFPGTVAAAARYPEQRHLARALGADVVATGDELHRVLRRLTSSLEVGDGLSGGADVVFDCAGTAASLREALSVIRPRGRVMLVGMPGTVNVDLTPLWHREVELVGAVAEPSEIVMVCRSTPPDVVVLDLEHPGVRQAEIGPRLRDACPGARLIGVAETDNPDLAQRAVDFGLSAVYLKTAPSEELIDLVKRAGEGEIVLESFVPAVPTQGNGAGPVPHGPSPRLTPREGQILRLLAEGRGTAQLARELAISPLTVQSHVKSILEKLGVHSKIEAVTLAFRTGMVGLPGVRATTGQAK